MAQPLSIGFASKCAFAATAFKAFCDPNAANQPLNELNPVLRRTNLTDPVGNTTQPAGTTTTFNTIYNPDDIINYATTYPFFGGSTWSARDQMGYITKGTGSRTSEVLITFRGSTRMVDDYLLIDGAFAPGTSPKGFAVHGGFAKVFQSCLPNILEQLDKLRPFDTIHCVGHSMGGALATLCAEHFIKTHTTPYLYTFGAPRVGLLPHAQYMQKHLGDRLNRYYYAGDVVTWLPMFPFVHMTGKRLISRDSCSASHIGYLHPQGLLLANAENKVDSWDDAARLIEQGVNAGGGCGMESRAWRYLTKALHKILYVVGTALGLLLIPGFTVLDQLVSSISYFVTQNPNRRPLIVKWLVGSFKALGKIVSFGSDKFVAMLRYILSLMLSNIRNQARREIVNAGYIDGINRNPRPVIRFS